MTVFFMYTPPESAFLPVMICEPCRRDVHIYCPEVARQAAAEGVVVAKSGTDRAGCVNASTSLTGGCARMPDGIFPGEEHAMTGRRFRSVSGSTRGRCPGIFARPAHSLGPDEVRQLVRECAVVVKPGETLVIQVN